MSAHNLTDVVDELTDRIVNDPTPELLTLGELFEAVGRRSYGPLLLLIGLFALSPITAIPGFTWLAAALTLIVAGQMAVGRTCTWLPRWALSVRLPRQLMLKGLNASRKLAARVDGVLKPRLLFMSAPPFVNVIALLCIAAALITFPLSFIPFAPFFPTVAILFFGLGMTARDGLWLSLGIGFVLGAFWLARPLIF